MISIIDYGMGNLGSISNMLKKIGIKNKRVCNAKELLEAKKIILPGVGSFDHAMDKLNTMGFSKVIKQKADSGIPIFGICLGMQLLGTHSEEGDIEGLNLIPGLIKKFPISLGYPVPHMGWNNVNNCNHAIFKGLEENKFYFVHSYYFETENDEHTTGTTKYGIKFASSINTSNIYGVQFHPEKSHKYGMDLFKNFDRF